jgi:L,D-peptidoglycan transpeptidase YkuD (ErfK/YbiS/YcfS/YnhG family)
MVPGWNLRSRRLAVWAVLVIAGAGSPSGPLRARAPDGVVERLGLPAGVGQVLVVETEDWRATTGRLRLWERSSAGWQPFEDPIEVSVGRSGMGWGRGLHSMARCVGPSKREGDGRAPAGIFSLGPAFGYDREPPSGGRGFPYRQATEADLFVDDPRSSDYNTWVRSTRGGDPAKRWGSFETMRRTDELYALGAVVGHNSRRRVPGAGSAIFLHVWRRPGSATAGCTAMTRQDMERVVRWLDPRLGPLLVQGPADALSRMSFRR